MQHVGFLGLGIMGTAMARNLLRAGYPVTVWNRTPARCDELVRAGARQGESPRAVVAAADVTLAMVADPAAALQLCFAPQGVLAGMAPGKDYVDLSTVDAATAVRIDEAIRAAGGRFLEAPVSGSKKPAEDGTLIILAAGDRGLYEQVLPLFDVLGKASFHLGEVGRGAAMKLVVNLIMGAMLASFGEGLALARAAQLPLDQLLEILDLGVMSNPMFRLKGPPMAAGEFPPAFPLKHMQKDLRLALQLGDRLAQPLPTTAAANGSYLRARAMELGEADFSAVVRAIVGE